MTAPRLHDQLCFQLYTATRLVVRAYQPVLQELGITYPQYLTLLVLWEAHDHGAAPPSVGELGERLFLDSGTLTPLLKRLEAEGLVTRTRSGTDERVVRIALTPAGLALAARAADVPGAMLCRYRGAPEALVGLREDLRALVGDLNPEG